MPVSKKRPKLPEEDLAAAVADIINSPITKPNLSFLSPPADIAVVHPKPPGIDSKPVGIGGEPGESADSLDISTKPSANPADFGPLPPGVNSTPLGIIAAPSIKPLWQAEGIGTLFEQSRVRRISQAQDALSLVEEKVYDLLWGTKNQRRDEFRLVHYSLQRIGTEARINIKTVRELIPRLIDKGFIQIEHHADVRRNLPTLYRVWSYAGVLANQKRHNRFYVAKSGKGVFYVHPVSASIGPASFTADSGGVKPVGFDLIPPVQRPLGVGIKPTAFNTPPSGVAPTGPMGVADVKPMGGVGSASLDSFLDRFIRQTSPTTYLELLKIIKETLNTEADDNVLTSIIATSHRNSLQTTGEPATDEELVHFTATKAHIISRAPNIRNHVAVLRKAVPECFLGETFRAFRAAAAVYRKKADEQHKRLTLERGQQEELAAEADRRDALWSEICARHMTDRGYDMQAIANDPDLDQLGRQHARTMMDRLGRYSKTGL